MNFYCYKGEWEFGKEPCGTEYKHIWKDLKTKEGALRRAVNLYGNSFRLFTFTNFYDNKTFQRVI